MGRKRFKGRAIDGVLVLHKDGGMTSNDALQKAKRLFFAAKAGHTGALDPLATGVLPLCFGEATKFSQYLLDADKRYRSTFCLGVSTETGDSDGEVRARHSVSGLTEEQIAKALDNFRGDIQQVPSMYSALKHQGQPLYKLARQGIVVEREPRSVTVYELKLLDYRSAERLGEEYAELDVEVFCSKGTYIRSIAEDLGESLGCGAHVSVLHRMAAGPFEETQAISLEALSEERGEGLAEQLDHHLLRVDAPVAQLPSLTLPDDSAYYFKQGNAVMDAQVYRLGDEGDMVRVFDSAERFLGVAELTDDGRVAPKRLLAS
ncbi:tRNA pseudouridine(55) synthase TruB [Pseudoteredinibacter isoporae]|uniref:tRNA pseudouridine synthase B n=1 Tax=Pseudoteredinibacter isoporae TaxID=570281 RepID=A0A7X0MX78_9GAMM|nr:tRNA pseudouridine(55) synthase TruB [Pseudoteredinibacter isoporae]MBB6522990.1 tRNA pseudouridine55 synthase [Pseudoteredinibacter isoporae]NHO88514.1 tRNA pseudouridine(55) synthase TruB [Pseudoteredinibacter isoporae]NIB22087.1 tRNA pseudouridine(55) synthase TruB [Pseudoteredinibacter isoporae]